MEGHTTNRAARPCRRAAASWRGPAEAPRQSRAATAESPFAPARSWLELAQSSGGDKNLLKRERFGQQVFRLESFQSGDDFLAHAVGEHFNLASVLFQTYYPREVQLCWWLREAGAD